MEASTPRIEPEPREWHPRVLWVGARLLCGAAAFFFLSFVFAYFYLRSLDVNKSWKIGSVHPSIGLGVAIIVVLVTSAVLLRLAAFHRAPVLPAASGALALALVAVVLQCVEYTTLGFGAASGGYASVFFGWTSLYALFTLPCAYWIETQLASAWRTQRAGEATEPLSAGIEACSFFWAFYVGVGVLAFVILYVV